MNKPLCHGNETGTKEGPKQAQRQCLDEDLIFAMLESEANAHRSNATYVFLMFDDLPNLSASSLI